MTTVDFNEIDWSANANDALFSAAPGESTGDGILAVNPRDVRRAETAPMVLTILGADGTLCVGGLEDEVAPGEEYRYTQEYHDLYFSKMPRDPRMLPPLTRRGRVTTVATAATAATAINGAASGSVHDSAADSLAARSGTIGEGLAKLSSGLPSKTPYTATTTTFAADHVTAAAIPQHQQQQSQSFMKRHGSPAEQQLQAQADVPPKVYASKLREYIETFRPDWGYDQIRGQVFEFSGDQDGSRLVQRLIEKPENMPEMFDEVYTKFEEMAKDVFGNYVLQKLFESVPKAVVAAKTDASLAPEVAQAVLAADMMPRLVSKVRGHLKEYSMNTYGCRVMQKALDNMDDADRESIIHEVDGCVTQCVFDQNANHVIQRMVEVCPARCQFIIDAFVPELRELSYHAYGCRVLQRTFEMCHNVPEVNIRPLLEHVLTCINEFTLHQFGNYVVQHAMLNAPEDLRARFVAALSPSVYALSCSKFASNVAEKVICAANEAERDKIIESLTKPMGESQGGNYLVLMMQDTYANYVVQRLLESVSQAQRQRIGELVSPHVELINASVYGRHLLRKMQAMEVISAEFLRMKGIDVTTSDYNGAGNNNGRGGNNRNHNGGNNNQGSNNGNGRNNRNGAMSGNNNSNNNNRNMSGNNNNNGFRSNNGRGGDRNNNNNNNNQQQQQQPHPQMMAAMPGMMYPGAAYPYMGYMPMATSATHTDPAQAQQQAFAMFQAGFPTPTPMATPSGYISVPSASVSPTQLPLGATVSSGNQGGHSSNNNNNNSGSNHQRTGGRRFNNNNNNNNRSGSSNPHHHNNNRGSSNSPQPFYVNGGYNPASAQQQQQQQQQQPSMMGGYFPTQGQQPMYMASMMPQPQAQMYQGNNSNNNNGNGKRFNNNNSNNATNMRKNANNNMGGGNNNNSNNGNRKQGSTTYVAPKRNGLEFNNQGGNQPYMATDGNGNFEAASY